MDKAIVARALAKYNVSFLKINDPQKGYRNESFAVQTTGGDMLNIIFYKSEPGIQTRIKNANAVGNYLAKQGFPARQTYSNRVLALRSPRVTKYAALYNYLPGHTIPWESYTQDHIKQLGKTMSDMHAALASHDSTALPDVTDEYLAIVRRMRAYFGDVLVQQALASKLLLRVDMQVFEQLEQLLIGTKLLPGKQVLHMDFVRSNVLFKDVADGNLKVRISGILDFEKAAYGHPLFDIARTLAFLLVDCKHKQPAKVRKYFLGSGYIKRGAATVPVRHKDMLDALITMFLFYDFYKFLRHNPYESLPQNEHFMRTTGMLIPLHLVVPTTSVAT